MKLEDQVCSLELSKKLKELGVKQESYFYWHYTVYTHDPFGWRIIHDDQLNILAEKKDENVMSVFTVAELGEILPKEITINNIHYFYTQIPCKDLKTWSIFYRNDMCGMPNCDVYDKSEANARAKMLIYLLENKLIDVGHLE